MWAKLGGGMRSPDEKSPRIPREILRRRFGKVVAKQDRIKGFEERRNSAMWEDSTMGYRPIGNDRNLAH